MSRVALYNMKKTDDFRQMAIVYLEDSELGGLKGTVNRLIGALDATRPLVTTNKQTTEKGDIIETQDISMVADQNTRMKALQEVIKIYGLQAPERKDVNVGISISSDEELFGKIEQAEKDCRIVESSVRSTELGEGPGSSEVVEGQPGDGEGNFTQRRRTLLQTTALQE